MKKLFGLALSAALVTAGCATAPADPTPADPGSEAPAATSSRDERVQAWGSLREVLRQGKTQARVDCGQAVSEPHAWGIGAPAGLAGEILIRDGEVWVSRVVDGQGQTQRASSPAELQAAFLAVSHVTHWQEVPVMEALAADDLDAFIGSEARRLGLDMAQPFPVVLEGPLSDLKLHVLNGACPFANPIPPDSPQAPARIELPAAQATVVGFYTDGPPGQLTHRGHKTHLHALLEDDPPRMGHVDETGVQPGAMLWLPQVADDR